MAFPRKQQNRNFIFIRRVVAENPKITPPIEKYIVGAGVHPCPIQNICKTTERAVKASKIQNIAGAKEKFELDIANYASEFYQAKYINGDSSATSLRDYVLDKIKTGADYKVDQKDDTTGKIKISIADGTSATGTVGEDGQVNWTGMTTDSVVKWEQTAEGITNGTVTLKIGDYVNYDPTAGATTTSYTSPKAKSGWENDQVFNVVTYKANGYGWRVFGIENGQIQLIADEMIGPDWRIFKFYL